MSPAATVAGVLFDATGTLIEATAPVGEVYHCVAREHGVDLPAWRLDDAFRRVIRSAPERGLDGATPDARRDAEIEWWFEVIRQTFQATDSTARFDDFRRFAAALFDAYRAPDAWRLRDGVADCLARISRQNVPMAVLSNFDHRLPEILESIGINHFFKSITLPFEHGAAKPAAAFLEAAAGGIDCALGDLVYIGDDTPERLATMRDAGLGRTIDVHTHPDARDWPALVGLD